MNIKELVEIHHKEIEEKTIISYPEVKDLCSRPYYNHPKGCPNIGKCEQLDVPIFNNLMKQTIYRYYFYLVYVKFDFKRYIELRKQEHQGWSDKQVKCVLYWQNSVKSLLVKYINNLDLDRSYILGCGSGMKLDYQKRVGSMENACINVFSTMRLNGIKMEVKPKNVIYLVCLIMSRNNIKFNNGNQKRLEEF